ncbi:ATP-binding protein [Prevotella melaninogenica]|uniref:ATP-binding protein n=1 Tax=Prevotella melaninogenica TaxID=28132 RepID=UPI001C5E02D5|nr:ATP-binding protein [Prevotella melaninogenica]MBW4742026.1 ATP-binding protein [Prevotella melaninogenica]MBW4913274.1 ATP-binding protein [Prevotella melaninogenica]
MLQRKIERTLIKWKNTPNHKPLIIKGCRQCGKTFSVNAFAKEYYTHVVYLNFFEHPDYKLAFEGSKQIDSIVMNLTALIPNSRFVSGQTCIILDEIQECSAARTALKFFKIDGRYDVIATGSLLGVCGYKGDETDYNSIPVGYEQHIEMFPLDFEEFLWANGINQEIIELLTKSLQERTPIPPAIHQRMRQLILEYTIVGGMPEVVNRFIATHNMSDVLEEQHSIITGYKEDMVKYAANEDKVRLRAAFDSIPRQLSKENKKFQFSVIKKGARAKEYITGIQWLEDAGIIIRCRNLSITELPLEGNAIEDSFKVYMRDTGLFVSMLEEGTQFDILQGRLYGYKGAIFENLIADIFTKMGRKLYYYRKDSGLEIDFVIRYHSECVLVEVKASTGNTKSTKTILQHPDKYHVYQAIKLGDYNIGEKDGILTLPVYMAFLLREY